MITIDDSLDMATFSVADVALNFPQAMEILTRYNLDYCCNGKKPFTEACKKANIDAEKVWFEILQSKANHGADNRMRFDTWQPELLIEFILQHHHNYVREAIPTIQELLDKVCLAHGNDQPELQSVRSHFNDLAQELLSHMPKEEEILFPAIRRLMKQPALKAEGSPVLENLQGPIHVMEHEHDRAGDCVKIIRALTNHYTVPAYACPTFSLTYKMLQEFDNDLMQHIHLENNILFPKVKVEV
jgi:regulator of cell morphogenesis and NO signaling